MPVVSSQQPAIRAAVVQMDVTLGDVQGNLARVLSRLAEAAEHGAKIIVFPEAALSGYCFGSAHEAEPYCIDSTSDAAEAFSEACVQSQIVGVLDYLEYSYSDEACENCALICWPDHTRAVYTKTHLPILGVDRFASKGQSLKVVSTSFGNIGPLICYDIRFPEAARCLGLMGADIIALPTNWPEGAESSPDFLTRARAWENRVYVLAANRVGVERGRRFIGRSQIVAPSGEILCEAGADEETILYAELDLAQARQKRIIIEPGEWELDTFGGRRPELYGKLTEK